MAGTARHESDPNLKLYTSEAIADYYTQQEELFPAERAILARVVSQCSGRPILDVGVGAGRTTPHLLRLSTDYLGIDYSAEMIEQCRRRFSSVHFEHADARKLDNYPKGQFAFILFSLNGMDYVSQEDRLTILEQLQRLLAVDGLFAFSTHNRLYRPVSPFNPRRFLTTNPLKCIWRAGLYFVGIAHYLRLRHFAYEGLDHALRIDTAFNYSLVTYNICAPDQLHQLQTAGFELLALFNTDGEQIEVTSRDTSPWLYYLVRRRE